MTTTLPTICQVVYDTDPPTHDPIDDEPLTPYRFSFLKSYSSSNSFERIGEGRSRFHGNVRHVTDSQVPASAQNRWRSGNTEGGRFLRRYDIERNEGHGVDLSRWITEDDSLDVDPGHRMRGGMDAVETDEKGVLVIEEEGWRHPTGSRKPTRLLWDPITNSWISQDPNNIAYLHFVNGLPLADRGIYSNQRILERRARFYPCMEKHLKSVDQARRLPGANTSMAWARQHLKRIGPSSPQHERDLSTKKDFAHDAPEFRSDVVSSQSSSSAIRGLIVVKEDEIDERGREEDEDSARGRSVATGSDEGRKKTEEFEEDDLDEDQKSTSADNIVNEEDVDDVNSLDRLTGASDDRSELDGSDNWSGSGSTRTRQRRRVQIDEGRRDSTDDEEETLPDRRTIEQKIRQMKEKEKKSDGKVSDREQRLRTLRERKNREQREEDSDEDKETDETRKRKETQELEIDSSSLEQPGSHSNGRYGYRISREKISLPIIEAEPRPESAATRRHPMRRRPSWIQRMRMRQARRGGMLRQKMDGTGEEGDNIDLRFEDYDWLAKYCILDPKTVTICKQIFDEVDEDDVGRLSCHQTMVALRASNYKLTDMLEQYMYKIMELTGYEIENGADYRLFSVLAALSQRITAVEDWMKCLINKMDMKTLETKLFICKTLWECSVDDETKTISLDDLCVELRAGGVSYEHEEHVRQKLQHLRRLDLLDFLTYVPLFIMIHESVVENPLDDRRYK